MSYEPTPEEVERVARGLGHKYGTQAAIAIRAFVPDDCVPVFLTREEMDELLLRDRLEYGHRAPGWLSAKDKLYAVLGEQP